GCAAGADILRSIATPATAAEFGCLTPSTCPQPARASGGRRPTLARLVIAMSAYRRTVEQTLGALTILSPTSFTWFAAPSADLPTEVADALDPASARSYLVHQIQTVLYADVYCAGEPRPSFADPRPTPVFGPSPFVHALSAANSSGGGREAGWTVVGEEDGRLIVERGGLRVWAQHDELYGSSLEEGGGVSGRVAKELTRLSPGFYMALGEEEFPTDGTTPIVRFYWNLRPEAAVEFVRLVTAELNGRHVAFRVKVVSDPDLYTRCDSAVLYVVAREYASVVPRLRAIYHRLAGAMNPLTPAFTKPLASGLA